jgi:hypothetical protein
MAQSVAFMILAGGELEPGGRIDSGRHDGAGPRAADGGTSHPGKGIGKSSQIFLPQGAGRSLEALGDEQGHNFLSTKSVAVVLCPHLRFYDRRPSVGEIQVGHPFLACSGKGQLARVALEIK